MYDFADSMQEIASRSRIIPVSTQAAVFPSIELVEETPIKASEGHKSDYSNINQCFATFRISKNMNLLTNFVIGLRNGSRSSKVVNTQVPLFGLLIQVDGLNRSICE